MSSQPQNSEELKKQLRAQGLSPMQAHKAAKICSTLEEAMQWIHFSGEVKEKGPSKSGMHAPVPIMDITVPLPVPVEQEMGGENEGNTVCIAAHGVVGDGVGEGLETIVSAAVVVEVEMYELPDPFGHDANELICLVYLQQINPEPILEELTNPNPFSQNASLIPQLRNYNAHPNLQAQPLIPITNLPLHNLNPNPNQIVIESNLPSEMAEIDYNMATLISLPNPYAESNHSDFFNEGFFPMRK